MDFSLPTLVLLCIRATQVPIQVGSGSEWFVESRPQMSKVLTTECQGFIGGFECVTTLDDMLGEINSWIENAMAEGKI